MKEKTLISIDFTDLLDDLKENVFNNHLNIYDSIEDDLITLCDNNFTCYKANMSVIKHRKREDVDHKAISYFENVARTVGESRVNCKAKINKTIHNLFGEVTDNAEGWTSDDIVYSVGEMLDRIGIEFLKQKHFVHNEDDTRKSEISKDWENRVKKYLKQKLEEITTKQFYEVVEETRTYKV